MSQGVNLRTVKNMLKAIVIRGSAYTGRVVGKTAYANMITIVRTPIAATARQTIRLEATAVIK